MATVTNGGGDKPKPPRPKRICFSFAAYATDLIERLKSTNAVVEEGLSDTEFSSIESNFGFTFPPDLRAILQQGLPISPGFPNWRSSSGQQLLNLPASSILRRVSNNQFWHPSWGPHPEDPVQAARRLLSDAPRLVPIYRHCYMPCSPNVAGNPVFHIDHDGHVRVVSFDVAGFFCEVSKEEGPVWAATSARRIGFWSEVADGRGWRWWWLGGGGEKAKLGGCLEGVWRRLREGGWKEEEIREMMTVATTEEEGKRKLRNRLKDREAMTWHVRVLSMILLRAGWSREDVVYSLGDEGNSWLEYHQNQH
ncbi:uncharacterized protein LOC130737273 [Lotus japonicus]|uniref:uncharacterized protein LOC130737273 n=1 Tax=Lotus japonicus TaxID=34305 RepID=UPI00258E11DD|nr:uncharacterized protein LOC130737273 [Lotus japonicus]